ncbi:DUF3616 domain-containing protein [Actinomycetospora termitidis]|uniref:DUF3616 domain-containing protein n=1 Tax=Actinomycetospora termitidis TaxID=3053470 RepID=A0ABT7MBP1_9PSEU|nr:DUF3616 domain-containing protein [Actinomycetospora sp. Odt1-22]MDL5158093.1 DUF3616 domain-containing protein [Actinomycetospora sp. Odt1-22]
MTSRTVLHLAEHTHTYGLSLSGLAVRDDRMLLAPDEGAALVGLARGAGGAGADWGDPVELPLAGLVDLPGTAEDEVDVEGIDVTAGHVWVTGSHSAKRKKVKAGTPPEKVGKRLRKVSAEEPRRLLARLPLGPDGLPTAGGVRLPSGRGGLFAALEDDDHLGPFLSIPGKDNGFDVEGLAAIADDRVLLGLRGPVLRGWAVVLELTLGESDGELELLDVRKHFLDLDGLGVRDLVRDGDDLLILAGPTMVLSRPARVLRVREGAHGLPDAVPADGIDLVAELVTGDGEDHPEAIAVLGPGALLVLHDSPADDRLGEHTVAGDVLEGLDVGRSVE